MTNKFERLLLDFTVEELDDQAREYDRLSGDYMERANAMRSLARVRRSIESKSDPRPPAKSQNGSKELTEMVRDQLKRVSTPDAVLAVLRSEGRRMTADEVLEALVAAGRAPGGRTPKNSVQATLSRLVKNELAERPEYGYYQAASETSDERTRDGGE